MRNERLRRFVGHSRIARKLTFGVQNFLQLTLLSGHKNPDTVRRLRACSRNAHSLLSADEAFILHEFAHAQARIAGDFAEFGVYRGASAALLCEVKDSRQLHLFDTFEGLPEGHGRSERAVFRQGEFVGTLPVVQRLLSPYQGVHFHQGMFPGTTEGLDHLRFSFVHLDVDLHDATLAGLEFFYPRMVPGGIILTHDYSIIPGVSDAFKTFFANRPERIIEFPTTQAMIIRQAYTDNLAA
ncbi:TylF/MycF/NovP-related O-methyltransferase [Gluconobacter morbifer]|nr:TylF/MycF/NovP-related O-methyltransferase [Gluconobacter morbifer]